MLPEMVRGGTKTESQFIVKLKTNAGRTDGQTYERGWTDQTLKDKRKDGQTSTYLARIDVRTDIFKGLSYILASV